MRWGKTALGTARGTKRFERIWVCLSTVFVAIALFGFESQKPAEEAPDERPRLVVATSKGPSELLKRKMQCWYCQSEAVLSEIRSSWSGVALAIGQGGKHRVEEPCRRLRASVAVLVARPPPPAPDSITRIYLLRGITLIRKATENCTENRIFALSHGLSEARQMFREVDQRLSVLEAESCDLLKANRDTCSESR